MHVDGHFLAVPTANRAVCRRPARDAAVVSRDHGAPGLVDSRPARDEGMRKAIQDPRADHPPEPMPSDGTRTLFGGFAPIVDA